MRWKTPRLGEYRTFYRFAIFPVECDDGTKLWLEWYVLKQEYKRVGFDRENFTRTYCAWRDVSRVPCRL